MDDIAHGVGSFRLNAQEQRLGIGELSKPLAARRVTELPGKRGDDGELEFHRRLNYRLKRGSASMSDAKSPDKPVLLRLDRRQRSNTLKTAIPSLSRV